MVHTNENRRTFIKAGLASAAAFLTLGGSQSQVIPEKNDVVRFAKKSESSDEFNIAVKAKNQEIANNLIQQIREKGSSRVYRTAFYDYCSWQSERIKSIQRLEHLITSEKGLNMVEHGFSGILELLLDSDDWQISFIQSHKDKQRIDVKCESSQEYFNAFTDVTGMFNKFNSEIVTRAIYRDESGQVAKTTLEVHPYHIFDILKVFQGQTNDEIYPIERQQATLIGKTS